MSLTLNQIIKRIRTIALAHKQIRNFYSGLVSDFVNDHKTLYPSLFLQDTGGKISPGDHSTTLNYKMFLLDLVHTSQDTKDNEQDVMSDMLSVTEDIIAQMNNQNYQDWILSVDNPLTFVVEDRGDMLAGVVIDISVRKQFAQNICAVPSDLAVEIPITPDMDTKVYDVKYVADGTESSTLNVPEIVGKKVLLVTRENNPLFKVSNLPNTTEFTWNDIVIGLSADVPVLPGERFLILYRNY